LSLEQTKQKLDNNQKFTSKELEEVGRTGIYLCTREVTKRFELRPGQYVIIPSMFQRDVAGKFFLRMFCKGRGGENELNFENVQQPEVGIIENAGETVSAKDDYDFDSAYDAWYNGSGDNVKDNKQPLPSDDDNDDENDDASDNNEELDLGGGGSGGNNNKKNNKNKKRDKKNRKNRRNKKGNDNDLIDPKNGGFNFLNYEDYLNKVKPELTKRSKRLIKKFNPIDKIPFANQFVNTKDVEDAVSKACIVM
jgi:hypothetical protein